MNSLFSYTFFTTKTKTQKHKNRRRYFLSQSTSNGIKEENDYVLAHPIGGIGSGVCYLSKVAYSLAKTMDFCQLFCGFEPTLGDLLNPLYHGPRQMAKWQRKNI
jgi:hypothetical protein